MTEMMVAIRNEREEAEKAAQAAHQHERVVKSDVHKLQLATEEGRRRQDQKKKDDDLQAERDAARMARKLEARQKEDAASRLLDGIRDMKIDGVLPDELFDKWGPYLYRAFSTSANNGSNIAAMTQRQFVSSLTMAVQASVFQATKDNKPDRFDRSLRALDAAAWPREMLKRTVVIAENIEGSGLTKSYINHLFRQVAPGSVELRDIVQLGDVNKSTAGRETPAVFQVGISETNLQQESMLSFLRTAHEKGIIDIKDSAGENPVQVIITAETRWDVTVSLQSVQEGRMAQNFMLTCNKLGLDKFTRDNILTYCVRNAPGLRKWSGHILWARLQRAKRENNEIIALHEDQWGISQFPNNLRAPNIIINVASAKVRDEIAEAQPEVPLYLGATQGDLITVRGVVSSRPWGQDIAGLDAAKLRLEDDLKLSLSVGGDILQSLKRAGEMAIRGQGRAAGSTIRECKLKSGLIRDHTAKFVQEKVQELVESLQACGGDLSDDAGRALMHESSELAGKLSREREMFGSDWTGVVLQLKSFPDDLPKFQGDKGKWWKYASSPEKLRDPLWTFLAERLEIPGILCVQPIMDGNNTWNKGEGVLIAIQLVSDFVKRCEPKQVTTIRPSLMPLFPSTSAMRASKPWPKIKVQWPGAVAQAPNEGDAKRVQAQIQELLHKGSGLWIPQTADVSGEVTKVFLHEEQGQAPLLLSALGEPSGTHDVRAIHHVLGCNRDECDNILEVIGELQRQGGISPVCEKRGLTLFIAKAFAEAFLEDPNFESGNEDGQITFKDAVQPGDDVRDDVIVQLGRTFCPLIISGLNAGVWFKQPSSEGQLDSAMEEQDAQGPGAPQSNGGRWWHVVALPHVLATQRRDDIAAILVEADCLSGAALAIKTAGATLLIQKDSFWRRQLLEASDLIPGQSIPTDTLPISSEDIEMFEALLFPKAAAIGTKWEETPQVGNMIHPNETSELVKALEQGFSMEIRREIWGALPPINHMSLIQVKDDYLRPSIRGPGVIFMPNRGPLTGNWQVDIENCRAEFKSEEPRERVRIRTVAELIPTLDVATFGVGVARILKAMAIAGRAAIRHATNGLIVILAERCTLDGRERSSLLSHGFGDLEAHFKRIQPKQSVDVQGQLNSLTMRECEQRLQDFFEKGQIGVLASAQVDDDGRLCPVGMEGVGEKLCLRRLIGHPAMCDSRGLDKLSDLSVYMDLRMLKVGELGHHLLMVPPQSDCPLHTCDENDRRLREWDPVQDDLDALLSSWKDAQVPQRDNISAVERSTEKRPGGEDASGADGAKKRRNRTPSSKTGGNGARNHASESMDEDTDHGGPNRGDQ